MVRSRPAPSCGRRTRFGVVVAAVLCAGTAPAGGAPQVVASIAPLHALLAGVMGGVGAPRLLLTSAASPHGGALLPSQARLLAGADVVFWIGPELETSLARPLAALAAGARVVAVSGLAQIDLVGDGASGGADPHLWLDPANARRMVGAFVAVLAAVDPTNASAYGANGARLEARLRALDAALATRLAGLGGRPYVVAHDSLAYLERAYGLSPAGAMARRAHAPPGARRLARLRRVLVAGGAACVFHGPGPAPPTVRALIAGTAARAAPLDVLGAPGAAGYFAMMRRLADGLAACLAPPGPDG